MPCHGTWRPVSLDLGRSLYIRWNTGNFQIYAAGLLSGISRRGFATGIEKREPAGNLAHGGRTNDSKSDLTCALDSKVLIWFLFTSADFLFVDFLDLPCVHRHVPGNCHHFVYCIWLCDPRVDTGASGGASKARTLPVHLHSGTGFLSTLFYRAPAPGMASHWPVAAAMALTRSPGANREPTSKPSRTRHTASIAPRARAVAAPEERTVASALPPGPHARSPPETTCLGAVEETVLSIPHSRSG